MHRFKMRCCKWAAGIMAAVFLAVCCPFTRIGSSALSLGYVQGGDSILVTDALFTLRGAVGLASLTTLQKLQADVDGDGNCSVTDALSVLRRAVGLTASFSIPTYTAHINATDVRLRAAPEDGAELTKMQTGEQVMVYGKAIDNWYHVEYHAQEGYCSADYVEINGTVSEPSTPSTPSQPSTPSTPSQPSTPSRPSQGNTQTGDPRSGVTTANVNFRTGPGTNYGRVDVSPNPIPAGTSVTVYGEAENGWYHVRFNGKDGYCSAEYIRLASTGNTPSGGTVNISFDVPKYDQKDEEWANTLIGGEKIRSAGCLVTCLAMCESFRQNTRITPNDLAAKYTFGDGGVLYWAGTGYMEWRNDKDPSRYLPRVLSVLQNGAPAVVGCTNDKGWMHWVVVTGYHGDGVNLRPEDFTVNDPGYLGNVTLDQHMAKYPDYYKVVAYINP